MHLLPLPAACEPSPITHNAYQYSRLLLCHLPLYPTPVVLTHEALGEHSQWPCHVSAETLLLNQCVLERARQIFI